MRKGVIIQSNDDGKMQTSQVHGLHSEVLDGVERYQDYGLSTVPMGIEPDGRGAECVIESIHGVDVVLRTDDRRYRPRNMAGGDVCLYTDQSGDTGQHEIRLTSGANFAVGIRCGDMTISMTSQDSTITLLNGSSSIMLTDGEVRIEADTIVLSGVIEAN